MQGVSCGQLPAHIAPVLRQEQDTSNELCGAELPAESGFRSVAEELGFLDTVATVDSGRVERHHSRGASGCSARDIRDSEDLQCTAGLRTPHLLEKSWPRLFQVMRGVAGVLLRCREVDSGLTGLQGCFGDNPTRSPPSSACLAGARKALAAYLGLEECKAEDTHPASNLRASLFEAIATAVDDPDTSMVRWLHEGSPMGINVPIQPGGHFPLVTEERKQSESVLGESFVPLKNHDSFGDFVDGPRSPALELVGRYVDAGYGVLFRDRKHAEAALSAPLYTSPLGDVVKRRDDGTENTGSFRISGSVELTTWSSCRSVKSSRELSTTPPTSRTCSKLARKMRRPTWRSSIFRRRS